MSTGVRILAQCLKASAPPGRQDPNVGVSDNRVVGLDANAFLENRKHIGTGNFSKFRCLHGSRWSGQLNVECDCFGVCHQLLIREDWLSVKRNGTQRPPACGAQTLCELRHLLSGGSSRQGAATNLPTYGTDVERHRVMRGKRPRVAVHPLLKNGREPRTPSIEGAKLVEELFVGNLSINVGGQEAVHPTLEVSVFLCPNHCEGSLLSLANFGSEQRNTLTSSVGWTAS